MNTGKNKKDNDKHIGLRVNDDLHAKLKALAEYEGRSINGELIYLVRQAILQHEKKVGELIPKE